MGVGCPLGFKSKPVTGQMVPLERNFFTALALARYRLIGVWGHNPDRPRDDVIREGFLSTSQAVAQHLPYLRRYARALSGSQASGDAYVAATLEALVQDPKVLDTDVSTRIALYRLFTKIWNSIGINGKPCRRQARASRSSAILRKFRRCRARHFCSSLLRAYRRTMRQRCLISMRQRCAILVEESGRELAAEIATDVLIIEDETFIALDLEGLVESLGHRVLGVARTHAEAVALAKAKRPGIILADIQLADGSSGLDAVNEMLRTFEVPVIFITAYPERFLTGERPEPAFLIAKPFQPSTVSAVLSQALFFERNAKRRERRAS